MFFAWAFELTPEGIKRDRDAGRSQSVAEALVSAKPAESIEHALIEKTAVSAKSIAVLPFVNMSSDPEQEYFPDGIAEELLDQPAKLQGLHVAGRTSSFYVKGKNEELKLIGEKLGVAHILEGSVRKAGNRARITAQLIKVSDGYHL